MAASQSRAVLSSLPVRTVLPSGLNATALTVALMRQGWADGLAGGGVPEPRRPVRAPGQDGLAVGAERHGHDLALMRHGLAEGLARRRRPRAAPCLSSLPVRTVLPSGLNATAMTAP